MLKVNDVVVNLKDKDNEIVKRIASSLNKLAEINKGDILLEFTDIHCKRSKDSKGTVEYATSIMLPYTETVVNNDGESEIWTYYETIDSRVAGKEKYDVHLPKRCIFSEQLRFAGNFDKGKAFFLIFISPRCEFIKGLEHLQNQKPSQKSIKVVLPEFENKQTMEYLRKETKVKTKIFEELNSDKIRTIAKAMGCMGVDTMGDATVAKQLMSVATKNEETMASFLELCSDTPVADIQAVISEAIEMRLLGTGMVSRWTKWGYIDIVNNKPDLNNAICKVNAGQDEREAINEYFVENPKDFEVLVKKLNSKKLKDV